MRRALCLLAIALPSFLRAEDPPIKMGLWESTNTTTEDGTPKTENEKHCITQKSWQDGIEKLSHPSQDCKSDVQRTGSGYSFKGTCSMNGATMNIEGSLTIADSEHTTLEAHTEMTFNGQKHDIKNHIVSHYAGASCGNVSPDE